MLAALAVGDVTLLVVALVQDALHAQDVVDVLRAVVRAVIQDVVGIVNLLA